MSLIDFINFISHNKGSIMPKNSTPFIAWGAAKMVQAGRLNFFGGQSPKASGGVDLTGGVGF